MIFNAKKIWSRQVELAPLTTFGLPARANYFKDTADPEELVALVQECRKGKKSFHLLAGGSNIVLTKATYPVVIAFRELEPTSEQLLASQKMNVLNVSAAWPLKTVVTFSITQGLAGLESLTDIPGSIGGAIFGNAGAYGHSISEVVTQVLIFDGHQKRWLSRGQCGFSYRTSIFKKKSWLILGAKLKFKSGVMADLSAVAAKISTERQSKYSQVKCPGSFFKNLEVAKVSKKLLAQIDSTKIKGGKIPIGYLLEEVGAKGMKVGGLTVADYHGNLFINTGNAKPADVTNLVKILKARVLKRFGCKLEEEVIYWK